MSDQILAITIWVGLLSLIAAAIALSWPYRRERRFVHRCLIAAPRETVWAIYHPGAEDSVHATFHAELVSSEQVGTTPVIWEQVVDASGGHGTHLATLRFESLSEQRPEFSAIRACEMGGQPYPYGKAHSETLELQEHPGGTLVTLGFHGETATLWQHLHLWRHNRGYLRRLQRFCESGAVAPKVSKGPAFWTSLALSGVAVGSFSLFFGWIGALLIAGILVAHEFGHWLAMRLTGQPAPRVLLIPFFGGVAVANHPHRTLFDDAFCSLMGPGFSALPALALLLAAWGMGVPDMTQFWESPAAYGATLDQSKLIVEMLALIAVAIAMCLGVLNLLQLMPVLPLDGGQVLRALVQSFSAKWARRVLLALTGLGIVGLGYTRDYILAGILGLGALQAWHMGNEAPKARPMSAAGATVICLGYGLTFAIHAGAVFYGFRVLAIEIP
jgi:Zn-dependent protease